MKCMKNKLKFSINTIQQSSNKVEDCEKRDNTRRPFTKNYNVVQIKWMCHNIY